MQHPIFHSSLLLLSLFSTQVLAHNVQTNVDVGVTFHIEPDHSPRVGEESQAWFALTRRGGELIPLSQCDCDLKVYLESQGESADEPILNPTLIAISPERYQNIPGANIVFPQPGIYQLELTGKPTQEGDFTPFQVSYPVTVNPGNSVQKKLENQPLETNKSENSQPVVSSPKQIDNNQETISKSSQIYPWLVGILASGLGITALLKLTFRRKI
ncbi:conserved exported hypothetical protein [Hyella patelloides LEGE 07179]|uniref:Transketolase n=1 Tax=Hyella patelloides LEGE 07179 TaxID=945734 RepID=A0A563VTH7_9CYAN|nr:hypothetical protein [Hyella patelloides]VEP14747.1 conserved exported hypothetical protein [Hyella patelloides LEGE 07179]